MRSRRRRRSGRPGPGEIDEPVGRERLGLVGSDRVVPPHEDLGPELLEEVHEVVGERVVVVDHQTRGEVRRCRSSGELPLGEVDRGLERGELAQALLVLGRRVGVGDDACARLQVRDAVRSTIERSVMHASIVPSGSA